MHLLELVLTFQNSSLQNKLSCAWKQELYTRRAKSEEVFYCVLTAEDSSTFSFWMQTKCLTQKTKDPTVAEHIAIENGAGSWKCFCCHWIQELDLLQLFPKQNKQHLLWQMLWDNPWLRNTKSNLPFSSIAHGDVSRT